MSRNLCSNVFEQGYSLVHEGGMDVPKVLKQMLDVVPGGQQGLAKRLSTRGHRIEQPQVSRWLKGAEPRGSNYQRIAALAQELGLVGDIRSEDVAALLDERRPSRRAIKILGSVGAGGQALLYSEGQGDHGEIAASESDPPSAAAALIVGTSLGEFFDGWYAVYDNVRRPVTDDLIDQLCVVGLTDGRVLIKKIKRNGTKFDLLSNEGAPIKAVDIEWAARVIGIRRGQRIS